MDWYSLLIYDIYLVDDCASNDQINNDINDNNDVINDV